MILSNSAYGRDKERYKGKMTKAGEPLFISSGGYIHHT